MGFPVVVKCVKTEDGTLPTKAHEDDACWDLSSAQTIKLEPRSTTVVSTGLHFEFDRTIAGRWCIEILSRSGLAARGIVVANSPGIIDPGYRGEIKVVLRNTTLEPLWVEKGDRIAQMRVVPTWDAVFKLVQELEQADSGRGTGGLGSSGK